MTFNQGAVLVRRLKVLGIGLLLGALFSLWTAGQMMPQGTHFSARAEVWALVMAGPVTGTAWGMAAFHPFIGLGWLGLLLIPAHPLRPHMLTAILTILGLALWFFAGFIAMMVAAWGA